MRIAEVDPLSTLVLLAVAQRSRYFVRKPKGNASALNYCELNEWGEGNSEDRVRKGKRADGDLALEIQDPGNKLF